MPDLHCSPPIVASSKNGRWKSPTSYRRRQTTEGSKFRMTSLIAAAFQDFLGAMDEAAVCCSALVRRATLESHLNGGARTQSQSRLRLDRLVRKKFHIKSLQNHCHDQAHFEHGELIADTLVGPAQEGEIRALRALRYALRSEA